MGRSPARDTLPLHRFKFGGVEASALAECVLDLMRTFAQQSRGGWTKQLILLLPVALRRCAALLPQLQSASEEEDGSAGEGVDVGQWALCVAALQMTTGQRVIMQIGTRVRNRVTGSHAVVLAVIPAALNSFKARQLHLGPSIDLEMLESANGSDILSSGVPCLLVASSKIPLTSKPWVVPVSAVSPCFTCEPSSSMVRLDNTANAALLQLCALSSYNHVTWLRLFATCMLSSVCSYC
jgi:hypothetical protein